MIEWNPSDWPDITAPVPDVETIPRELWPLFGPDGGLLRWVDVDSRPPVGFAVPPVSTL